MDAAFWDKFLLDLINAAVPVILSGLAVIIPALVALIVQKIRLVAADIKASQPTAYEQLEKFCADAVIISEQMNIGKFIVDKKKFAIEYVQSEVDKAGLKFSVETISLMIEKAVYLELQ
jgi:hypothetical protein